MKKEELMALIRANTKVQVDMPDMNIQGITFTDPIEYFVEMTHKVGGSIKWLEKGTNLNTLVHRCYPEARIFATNLKGIDAQLNPDTVTEAAQLNGTDVGIVRGSLGVAENACVWVPQTMKEKAVCFISENLIIVLNKANIVNNMHEAYERIEMSQYGFGTFISGPSKTADIEQALVMGAQAAKTVTVILTDGDIEF